MYLGAARTRTRSASACDFFICASSVISALVFLYFVAATGGKMSGYDFLDWIIQYGDGPNDWLNYLWTPHNEHRIAADRLLVAADIELFGGVGIPFVVVRSALLMTMVIALASDVWRTEWLSSQKAPVISFLIFALLPANIVVMCSMPLMGGFIHTCTFAVFALLLWDNHSFARQSGAVAAAFLAAFGVAGGLFIWPVLTYFIWRNGGSAFATAIVMCLGLAVSLLYMNGLATHPGILDFDGDRLIATADFVIRFLGLPWSHASFLVWPSRILGMGVLLIGSWVIITDVFSDAEKHRIERVGLGMIQFAFITALAAALSRWDTAPDREMPIRYGAVVALAHAGLLLVSARWLFRETEGRFAIGVKTALAVTAAILLLQQIIVGRTALQQVEHYASDWDHFAAGEWTTEMLQYVYPERSRAEQILAYMKTRRIYGQTNGIAAAAR
jgi:hypothetical protein